MLRPRKRHLSLEVQQRHLDELWREMWKPKAKDAPWLWLEKNVERIPYSPKEGRYKSSYTPIHRLIMEEYAKRTTRLLSVLAPIQYGKTFAEEGLLTWNAGTRPGPTLFLENDDPEAKDECQTRLQPLFLNTKIVKDLMPPKHERRQDFIQFTNGMPLWVRGAIKSNLNRLSVRDVFFDEWWQYKANNIIEYGIGRTSAFGVFSKIMLASQAGEEGQEGHQVHENTNCLEEHLICPECGAIFPWTYDTLGCYKEGQNDNDGKPKLSFDCCKRPDGTYDYNEVKASSVCMCPHCAAIWKDSDRSRNLLKKETTFIATNPNSEKGHIGIHFESNGFKSWGELNVQFLKAHDLLKKGIPDKYKLFKQQRRAIKWTEETEDFEVTLSTGIYRLGEEWEKEAVIIPDVGIKSRDSEEFKALTKDDFFVRLRIMTVDVQFDHFFVVVCSISISGAVRIFKRAGGTGEKGVRTWGEVEDIANECGVDPQLVFVDVKDNTYVNCVECHERGYTPLMGSYIDEWKHPQKGPNVKLIYSPNHPYQLDGGNFVKRFMWSNLRIKDMLSLAIKNGHIQFARNIGQVFLKHMESEHPVTEVREKGKIKKLKKRTWVQIGKRPNHYWDCMAMMIVALVMLKILRYDIDEEEPDEENDGQVDE